MTQAGQDVAADRSGLADAGQTGGLASPQPGGVVAPPAGPGAARGAPSGEVPVPAAVACLSCLAGGWIAAGSVGMLDDVLRHALMWSAFALAVFADRVFRPRRTAAGLVLIVGAAAVVAMGASRLAELNILAAALLAALLAPSRDAPARRALITVAQALVVLAVWRLLVSAVPILWVAADRLGLLLGQAGSAATDRPLWTGATFGGVDFLVTMLALLAGYLPAMRRRRVLRGLLIVVAIAAGHLLYLVVLAFCPQIVSALPDTARRGWDWASAARTLLPWNVPALAAAIHLAIAAAMIRWSTWPAEVEEAPGAPCMPARATVDEITPRGVTTNGTGADAAPAVEAPRPDAANASAAATQPPPAARPRRRRLVGLAAAIVVAAALPVAATFSPGPCSLAGKKVIALESNLPGWSRPSNDTPTSQTALSSGTGVSPVSSPAVPAGDSSPDFEPGMGGTGAVVREGPQGRSNHVFRPGISLTSGTALGGSTDEAESFGMLGGFVESLGGRWLVSADLSPADLADASVLLVIGPNRPWQPGQLKRIDDFVRGGGSLLVAGAADGPCNELLAATSMKLRPGAAASAVKGWAGTIEALWHPATTGIGAGIGAFGPVGGAPLAIELPAWPMLAGRWGWADAPDAGGAGASANGKYDAGEKLGDLVLSGERKLGRGTIVALADGAVLGNLATAESHAFVGRLLGYLAARPSSPAAFWRQAVSLAAGLLLALLLLGRAGVFRPAAVAIILAGCLWASTQATSSRCQVQPAGKPGGPQTTPASVDAAPGWMGAVVCAGPQGRSNHVFRPDISVTGKMLVLLTGKMPVSLTGETPVPLTGKMLVPLTDAKEPQEARS
jgi:hypothetical protein